MKDVRQLTALAVVAAIAVLAAGWFLLVSPQRSKATDLHSQQTAEESRTHSLLNQIQQLKAERQELPQVQAELAKIALRLPANPSLPALVGELTKAADGAKVDLQTITPAAPVATTTAATGPQTLPAKGTATGQGAATPTGTLMQVPVTLTAVGSYFELELFLSNLEHLQRAMFIPSINIVPGNPLAKAPAAGTPAASWTGDLTATIQGVVFMVQTTDAQPTSTSLPSSKK